MGKLVIVLGPTGSGKSTSIKTLDPKETYIVRCAGNKDLPFKGSRAMYNAANKNIADTSDYIKIVSLINNISEKAPNIKNLILDDVRWVMADEFGARAKETGYNKFTDMAVHFKAIIDAAIKSREDLNIALMMHDDDVSSNNIILRKKVKLVGKLVEDQFNPVELVTILLYSHITFDDKDQRHYSFSTHACKINDIEIPSKSPDGMFEEDEVPNDLQFVFNKADEYYGLTKENKKDGK